MEAKSNTASLTVTRKELLRLANFMLVDARLIFIIVSVYITISSAITSAANNEAAADVNGNATFDLSARSGGEHDYRQIRDVSNPVLWNCREKSVTRKYYQQLYGSLFGAFALILLVFILTRLSIIWGNKTEELNNLKEAMRHIQIIKCLRNYLKSKWRGDEVPNHASLVKNLSDRQWPWDYTSTSQTKANYLCSMLLIPFFEVIFLILSLPFMLTTYDLNPIGCLVGPNEDATEYDEITGTVHLQFTDSVLAYQKAALVIFILLILGPIPIFGFLLLLQYLRISRNMFKNIAEKLINDDQPV